MHVSSNECVIDQIVPLYTVITGRRWPSHIPETFEDLPYRPSYIMSASKPRRGQVRRDRSDLFGDPSIVTCDHKDPDHPFRQLLRVRRPANSSYATSDIFL